LGGDFILIEIETFGGWCFGVWCLEF